MTTPHVAVLMGGLSTERDVSLVSGTECVKALEGAGYRVTQVDAGRDLAAVLVALKPDVALNCLHGAWGEDGTVQGILETLQIPYTHSGVLASALAMDKTKAKAVLAAARIKVPGGGLADRLTAGRDHILPLPYVVKPNAQGSSVGTFIVREGANCPPAALLDDDWSFGEQVLVEPFIAGRELTVAVMGEAKGPRALAVTEIVAATGFYDYEAKYQEGGSRHIVPADLPADIARQALRMAEQAHTALGCRGISRSDFRYDADRDGLVLLEVNTQPGMTPLSLAPEQAAYAGMDFTALVRWLVDDAGLNR